MSTLQEAHRLYKLGFAILPLKPKSKMPKISKWTTGERLPWNQFKEIYREGDNTGVRLGEASKIGENYLACIDVDIHDDAFKAKAESILKKLLKGKKCPEVLSGSGNGSRHLYCVTKEPFKMLTVIKEEGGEICVYSSGRQMVLPGSIHPDTGKTYKWIVHLTEEDELPIIDFGSPAKLEIPNHAPKASSKLPDFDFKIEDVDVAWLPISEKVLKGITAGEGVEDRSNFLLPACQALVSAGLTVNEILNVLTDPQNELSKAWFSHTKSNDRARNARWIYRYTLKRIIDEKTPSLFFGEVVEDAKVLSADEKAVQDGELAIEAERPWYDKLDRERGKLKTTLKNLNLILTNTVEAPLFIKDVFANRISYGVNTPWGPKKGEYLNDIDVTLLKSWLGHGAFNIEPSTEALYEVTALIAHHERVHPVIEWLESLEWDGVARVDTWIKDYCNGVAEEPYLSEVSRKFLLAMVSRVFEPGCQWDYVLVLEGGQGKYKSSIARAIASDRWFMDNLPDLRDKDAMLNLQGKWLIELGELTSVKRSDFNTVKQYLIRRTDTVRPHYGRIAAEVKRQSVFIGTVNDGQYLKDPTGNRRFWPVKVGVCRVDALKEVRDQLFAEAMFIYKNEREVLKLSRDAEDQAGEAQEERRIEDDDMQMKQAFKKFKDSEQGENFNFKRFKLEELFIGPSAPFGKWNDKNYGRQTAAQVLHNEGFENKKIQGTMWWKPIKKDDDNFY